MSVHFVKEFCPLLQYVKKLLLVLLADVTDALGVTFKLATAEISKLQSMFHLH